MVSRYLSRRPTLVHARFKTMSIADLATCSVVEAELRFGVAKAPDPVAALLPLEGFLQRLLVLDFDSTAAKEYGRLRAHLERAGTLIGPNDLMIASIALAHDLTLVPHNVAEFSRAPGLTIEDWEA